MNIMQLSRALCSLVVVSLGALSPLHAQELPATGVTGFDIVSGSSPGGLSQLYAINIFRSLNALPLAAPVNAVPSRWAHRLRVMGGLETAIASPKRALFLTPMGDAVGNGAIHLVDLNVGASPI